MTPESFWTARDFLDIIYRTALALMVSPYAVLGYVLARVATVTPPEVVLPPIVGGKGSLNVIIAIVGPSGSGKGAAAHAASNAVIHPEVYQAPAGSGEGMVKAYAHRVKTNDGWETVMDRSAVHFNADEADTIAALGSRTGSTTSTFIRSAWSCEGLGATYSDETKRVTLAPHSYRFALTVSVQPKRSGALLGEAAGGTPQRVVWLPSLYSGLVEDPEPAPEPYELPKIDYSNKARDGETIILEFPDHVTRQVRRERYLGATGAHEVNELDSHSTQVRLKVAALLAIMRGSLRVSMTDWRLSGHLMDVSTETRSVCVAALEEVEADTSRQRGRARAVEKGAREDHEEELKDKRWAAMHRNLSKKRSMLASELAKSITKGNRCGPERLRDELADYVGRDWLLYDDQTRRYRLGPNARTP